jgi:hypothetical protein
VNLPKLLSFESGRIVFFETLTKHPENWQQNPTPLCIVRKMLDKTSLEDKKILVLFNIEFLQVLVEERKINPENIYYIADNELEYLSAIKIFKVQSYKLSDFSVPVLKKLIAGIDMKFDLVFSNPPYNGNIDIKILNEIIDIADEFVVVHPSTWLIDRQGLSPLYNKFKNILDGKLKSVDFFNGNPIFNIGLFTPCVITHIDCKINTQTQVNYFGEMFQSNIYDISIFGSKYNSLIKPFTEKMKQNITLKTSFSDDKKYLVQLAVIIGHSNDSKNATTMLKDDFYTIVMKDSERNKGLRLEIKRKDDSRLIFSFNTEQEQDNFLNYLKTDFARFCLSMYKVHSNQRAGALNLIPWIDFTEEWDDDKLFAKFDVSQELQDYIRDFLPDYYGIRK